MNPRICILLNSLAEFDFQEVLHRHLPADVFDVTIAETFPSDPSKFQLIVPWNYRNIIENATQAGNIIVMHAAELPQGRGWAPIYHTFFEQQSEYVISGIVAANKVDTGDIIVRARFPMKAEYTAPFIRKIDEELSLLLIAGIVTQWPEGNPAGVKQSGIGSYRARRYPRDSEVDISKPLETLIPHLRGVESKSPAFFFYNNVKYLLEIRPEFAPSKPAQVTIEYPALNKVEIWEEWA
jgi:methionyl-tRNA formyltransferase